MADVAHEPDCRGFKDERGREEGFCDDWCWSHYACEPLREGDYLICPECLHAYRTAEELVESYRAVADRFQDGVPEVTPAADEITFCQHCAHDF